MGQAQQAQPVAADAALLARAVDRLRRGGVVAFPTETVYGLGADATNAAAVRRLFEIKGRPATNPLIVHVADVDAARRCVAAWPVTAERLAARFWPGPLTIVLPKSEQIVPEVTASGPTVGVRVPDHPLALAMLRAFGGGVAAPSANRSNHVSPTTAQHVHDDLGKMVDLILDGGQCGVGIESTVLSLATSPPTVLRPGGVGVDELREVLGDVEVGGDGDSGIAASPGRLSRHYAPRTPCVAWQFGATVATPAQTPSRLVVLALPPVAGAHKAPPSLVAGAARDAFIVAMPDEPTLYARALYGKLREADRLAADLIAIELPPDEFRWAAVRDRIMRATST